MSWTKTTWLVSGVMLALSAKVFAQEPSVQDEPRLWNPSFVYGATTFGESDSHQTVGVTFRIRLTDRVNVEPEFRYMSLPATKFESTQFRRESKHSDFLLAGNLVYDFRDESVTRFVPYVSVGAGWGRTTSGSSFTEVTVDNAVPVFPVQTAPLSGSRQTSNDWLWLGAGVGVRIVLPHGFFVSPEVRLGGTSGSEIAASAAIKVGYGF